MRIIVIGSGFGGLSAAIRLRAQGHEVTVVEQRDKPGGRAYVYQQDGFTFDGGPTIITAPWLFDELFAEAGKKVADYVQIVPIDPFYQIRFEDGTVFRYNGDTTAIIEQIRKLNPDDVRGYRAFLKQSERVFGAGMSLIDKPFTTLMDMVKVLPDLIRLRADRSVAGLTNRHIRDERLRQVFSFHPLLVGGNPFETTSIYTLIHHLEKTWGVWFAMGGTGKLVEAFVRCLEDIGGELRLSTTVDQIMVDERTGKANGVRLTSGEVLPADAVVSNGDVAFTYKHLIAPKWRKKNTDARIDGLDYSMSLMVIYFGTNKQYEDIAHHEIIMGPRYKGLLDEVFGSKTLAKDFSLYLHRPTATDPSLAPPGCDAWYVLSPVPHLGGPTDWRVTSQAYRDRIMQYLEDRYLPGLSKHLVTEHRIDPLHFRDTLSSHLGSAFSVQPTLLQSAWFRPHNKSEDIPNLYFAGAGTHPGAGLPGVISSGKIVADLIGSAA
ncbi:MAG: phytoene desaturase [Gemmatimonadota bacterium]|jgi:phytoene desaturase|nr:phytoene desaturase [Gemmatimonadota bacterium]MDQ8150237.1 phytoene desaturase [Gemmatimonadota bacterium]MDQ8151646.1 phytoene desaturase [Gemmatimonadota bacterium]MDQ8169900.1 phytoene desaturase [Gemmatimonadota bacterium]MDQ8177812.1 phytoene desaturase [Gemmatimonadota bacterium]